MAFYCVLTRITDFKHHPTDVASGAILGIAFAWIEVSLNWNLKKVFTYEISETSNVDKGEQLKPILP
jgi:hypothetical protein